MGTPMEQFYKDFFGVMGKVTVKRINEIDEPLKCYDVLIKLDSGQFFKIIEKHDRYKNTGNVVLELWSDLNHKKGWLYAAQCDWLAYHYDATGITHFIPMPALRKAWKKYEAEWRDTYRTVLRENAGWTTQIILIPLDILWSAIQEVLIHDHNSDQYYGWHDGWD